MFINDAIALGTACHTLKWKSVELKTKVGAYFYHPNRKYCLRCLGVLCNKAVTFFFVCLFVWRSCVGEIHGHLRVFFRLKYRGT